MKNDVRSIRLLLVDDDELSREVLTLQLNAQGYEVLATDSGDAALGQLAKMGPGLPDAVLTDLKMPGTSGMALARQLRATAVAAGSPGMVLLAMSASQPDEDLYGGYDGFLMKPFTMLQLADVLQLSPVANPNRATASGSHRRATASGAHRLAVADTAAAASAADGTIDPAANQRFAGSMSASRLQEFYTMCLEDAEARIGRMRAAAVKGDNTEYRRQAHTIKGSCSMVGAVELQQMAAQQEARGIDPANHVASLDEMLSACGRLRRILIAHEDRAIR